MAVSGVTSKGGDVVAAVATVAVTEPLGDWVNAYVDVAPFGVVTLNVWLSVSSPGIGVVVGEPLEFIFATRKTIPCPLGSEIA